MTSVLSDIVKVSNLDLIVNDNKQKKSIDNSTFAESENSVHKECSAVDDTLDTSSSSKITSASLFNDQSQLLEAKSNSNGNQSEVSPNNNGSSHNNNSSESDLVSSVSTAATSIAKNHSEEEFHDPENEQQLTNGDMDILQQNDAVDPENTKVHNLSQRTHSHSINDVVPNLSEYIIQPKPSLINSFVNNDTIPRVRSKSASNVPLALSQPPCATAVNNSGYQQDHSNSSMSSFSSSVLISNNTSHHRPSNTSITGNTPPLNISKRSTFPQVVSNNDNTISIQSSVRSRNNSAHTSANAPGTYASGNSHHYYGTSSSGFDERASLSSSKLNESAIEEIQRMKFMVLNKREIKKNKKKFLASSNSDFFNANTGNNNSTNNRNKSVATATYINFSGSAHFNDGNSISADQNNFLNHSYSNARVDAFVRQIPTTRTLSENLNVGTGLNKVYEGHGNFIMAYNMLTGIRVAVSRCSGIMKPLKEQDFKSTKKLTFDIVGNELTPSSKYDFKFKDYAPNVFRELREMFGLDPADYLVSLTAKYVLSEMNSPGKSGSFFYYSRDYKFIIKTIHRSEHITLRRILKNYHDHVKLNPNTLVSQFYGLHRLKMPLGKVPLGTSRKIYFIVMNNLFPPNYKIDRTYDLKGSLWKRETIIQNDKGTGNSVDGTNQNKYKGKVLKDQNWLNNKEYLRLKGIKRDAFITQLSRDVQFLIKSNIMDYSLLLGIYEKKKEPISTDAHDKTKSTRLTREKINEENDCSTIERLIDNLGKFELIQSATSGNDVKTITGINLKDKICGHDPHDTNCILHEADRLNLDNNANLEDRNNDISNKNNFFEANKMNDQLQQEKKNYNKSSNLLDNTDNTENISATNLHEKVKIYGDNKPSIGSSNADNGNTNTDTTTATTTNTTTTTTNTTTTNGYDKHGDKLDITIKKDDTMMVNNDLTNVVISSPIANTVATTDTQEYKQQSANLPHRNVVDILAKERFYFYNYKSGFNTACSERHACTNDFMGDDDSDEEEIVYYIGIIDCLTNYSLFKRAETFVKGFYQNRKEISAVPAHEYGDRFLRFIREKGFSNE